MRAGLRDLVVLGAGGNDGNARAGVGKENGGLVGGERGIDGYVDGSESESGEVGYGPLPAIFAEDGDAVALADAPAR